MLVTVIMPFSLHFEAAAGNDTAPLPQSAITRRHLNAMSHPSHQASQCSSTAHCTMPLAKQTNMNGSSSASTQQRSLMHHHVPARAIPFSDVRVVVK